MKGDRPRRGLRASVTLAFAAGALALSVLLALGTYFSARHFLVQQRERTATRQAFTDGALVRDSLQTSGAQVSDVLGSVSPPAGAVIYLRRHGEWYSSVLDSAGPDLTAQVQPLVAEGAVGVGWTDDTDPSAVVVGIPLPAVEAEYYEVSVAEELDRTLWTLSVALAVCAGLTTIAGVIVGRAASRRVLAPLEQVTHAAVRVSAGDLTTRLGATQDPDLAALVGSFNHMVDALRQRIEQDARFAADVSHELRTPVTTLTTSLSLLERSPDLSPRSAQAVRLMSDELSRFRRALEDLLALGRLDAGGYETEPCLTGALELVQQALRATGHPPGLVASRPEGEPDPTLWVDRVQMLRVFTNLFRNADLHGGGLTGVSIRDRGDVVDVQVEDRGSGVPTADRTRVFERFARAGGKKTGTGSGLGLSIVEQTVRNHGGDVWCADRPGGGAVFVVRLPSADGADR
ncbi:HAMP domain-containing sensor histidine kinase [Nocardioides sp. YIM 152315]|uniref:sensor histidine kinase n=1 Tax=Nocardioides sp. YIM 152315 TaxID=3031760 RepID=UPI0023DCC2B2|nr:HAMP domain-containing sensor histidine kinase [Nocardioides sp. YIM 152315]MDF1605793.1 HAMP domain-containing sensor histidine kinase [Nocardioides sp. YIM 152315]